MNNNLLREIEPILIKKGNASYTSIDICIKENNIFGLLFISGIVPTIKNIIQTFNNLENSLTKEEDIFKLIICICDEEKTEYDATFSLLSNLTCFIIPYEYEGREKLISNYNVISLPCLIIFNKDGKSLSYLSNEDINNISKEVLKGWKNNINIINNYKLKSSKYVLGDIGYVFGHHHKLIYTDYLGKSPNYGKGNWYCDICGVTNKYDVTNFYCDDCGYDVCDACYEKNKKFY